MEKSTKKPQRKPEQQHRAEKKKTSPPSRPLSTLLREYRTEVLIGLALTAAILMVFGKVVFHQFINLDDTEYVFENPIVPEGLTWVGIKWAFTTFYASNYWQPVTWISHMTDCQFYGLNAGGHHLTSLLLHSANTVLLFLALRRMTGKVWHGAAVAALFALHPMHVESVAWVAERKDVLSSFFWMLALWAYAWYAECPASWKRYGVVMALMALGLMSKPMIVTLPFAFLLLDYWPLDRLQLPTDEFQPFLKNTLWPLVKEKIPLLALSAGTIAAALYSTASHLSILGAAPGLIVVNRLPLTQRCANALVTYVVYLDKTVWPARLAISYVVPLRYPTWQMTAAGGLLLLITAAVLWQARRHPYLVVGWLWFLGTLLPVTDIGNVVTPLADRYSYLPHIGLFVLVVWTIGDVTVTWPHRKQAAAVLAGVVLLVLGMVSWVQVGTWRDSRTVFGHAVAVAPDNYLPYCLLGRTAELEGDYTGAEDYYRKSVACQPRSILAWNGLGVALSKQGREAEAVVQFLEGLKRVPKSPEIHFNYGILLARQEKYPEAAGELSESLRIRPNNPPALNALGSVYVQLEKYDEAVSSYTEAVKENPGYADAYGNLGKILIKQGKYNDAIPYLKQAIQLDPKAVTAYRNLGAALFQAGRMAEAAEVYSRLVAMDPSSAEIRYSYGMALAKTGRRNEAIEQLSVALRLKPGIQGAQEAIDALKKNLPVK